jgi:hypothetical protein
MPRRQHGLSHRLIEAAGEWAVLGAELSDYGAGVDPQALGLRRLAGQRDWGGRV